jgi:hypothetical protein
VISIGEANLSSCSEALSLMGLTPANAATKLLPTTQEWGLYSTSLDESIELRNPNDDRTKCGCARIYMPLSNAARRLPIHRLAH